MTRIAFSLLAATTFTLAACSSGPVEDAPLAGEWVLVPGESHLSFVTVKNAQVAEAHHFTNLAGLVSADGAATLAIDLSSVETNIDIRNERARDLLFDVADFPEATVSLSVDPASLASLQTGDSTTQEVTASLAIHGVTAEVPATLTVTRIAPGKVQVASASPVIVEAGSLDLAEGVEELREIANLDSITGAVPVTFELTFTQQ